VLGLAAVGLSIYRCRRDDSRITRLATVSSKFRPAAKGQKPMVQRRISRDIMKRAAEGFLRHPKRDKSFIENIIKTQLHGRFQLKLETEHMVDNLPIHQMPTSDDTAGGRPTKLGHKPDDPYYDRRFLNPAKFKKMAIAHWEMPESATKQVTLKELVDAGVQYGHKSNKWNPKMLPYLYADNDGTHIFDLVMTSAGLNRACYYCMEAAARGAEFIAIGTKEAAREHIAKFGEETGVHYIDQKLCRWSPFQLQESPQECGDDEQTSGREGPGRLGHILSCLSKSIRVHAEEDEQEVSRCRGYGPPPGHLHFR